MPHTIRKRFAASLAANILRSGISFSTGMLLARWMGPEDYGRMAFLLASFLAVRQLLDMASSSAFFTFLSRGPRSQRFVSLYWRWVGIQFFVVVLVVGLLFPDEWIGGIWKGEGRSLVVLAFGATFMQSTIWQIASQMAEAQRETIRVQRLNTLVVLIHLGVVLSLWWAGQLAIPLLFAALALEWGFGGWLAARLYRGQAELAESERGSTDTVASVWAEFWRYCLPFVPYAWLGFAHDFGDRWMLQHWGGAAEQAYYAVAGQFAAVALLATASILRIFWKEIAEAHHRQDHARVERLYLKASRGLYFVGAVVAGGLLPWAREILQLTLGAAYAGGAATLMMMFLYPVHQSMGQIGGTMLYATGHTRIQVVLGLAFMASSLVVAYFMMAPVDAAIPGLALASEGLAYKMVIMQLVQVNIMAWFISRVFRWKYDWRYQITGLVLAVAAGWLAKIIVTGWGEPDLIAMVASVPIYLTLVFVLLYSIPSLVGAEKEEISLAIKSVRQHIRIFTL